MSSPAQVVEARHPWHESTDEALSAQVRELNGRGLRVTALSLRSEYLPRTGIRVLAEPAENPQQTVEHRYDIKSDADLAAVVLAYNATGSRIATFAIRYWGQPCVTFILEQA